MEPGDMDGVYMNMARSLAARSHCMRRKVGAVLVSAAGDILAQAVNDPVPDKMLCEHLGCLREEQGIASGTQPKVCRCVHCEQALVLQCTQKKMSVRGATVYTTLHPCSSCAEALIAAGVERVVYGENYPDRVAGSLLREAGVRVEREDQ